jgi:hypothetical protein
MRIQRVFEARAKEVHGADEPNTLGDLLDAWPLTGQYPKQGGTTLPGLRIGLGNDRMSARMGDNKRSKPGGKRSWSIVSVEAPSRASLS